MSRYRIALLSAERWSGGRIAKAVGCRGSTLSRTPGRFECYGDVGLIDGRNLSGRDIAVSLH